MINVLSKKTRHKEIKLKQHRKRTQANTLCIVVWQSVDIGELCINPVNVIHTNYKYPITLFFIFPEITFERCIQLPPSTMFRIRNCQFTCGLYLTAMAMKNDWNVNMLSNIDIDQVFSVRITNQLNM
jgi:hypothetical protein